MTQSQLNKLSLSELSNLNRMVVDTIKSKKKTDSKEKRKAFSIGDKVIVEHKKTTKVSQKNARTAIGDLKKLVTDYRQASVEESKGSN